MLIISNILILQVNVSVFTETKYVVLRDKLCLSTKTILSEKKKLSQRSSLEMPVGDVSDSAVYLKW
jgi:hypothetical protein